MSAWHGHRELLLEIPCIQSLWHLTEAAEDSSHEHFLSGVSTEARILQSTDEGDQNVPSRSSHRNVCYYTHVPVGPTL